MRKVQAPARPRGRGAARLLTAHVRALERCSDQTNIICGFCWAISMSLSLSVLVFKKLGMDQISFWGCMFFRALQPTWFANFCNMLAQKLLTVVAFESVGISEETP